MDSKALNSAISKFSARFCNELDKNKSVVTSPLSAEILLALLTLGTVDPSHVELVTALGIPDDDAIRSSFKSLCSMLKSVQGVTLNVANKIYLKEGDFELEPRIKEDAVEIFDAAIEKIDFCDCAAAAECINKWVESKTNERIKKLISPDSLNADTRLVLVNAIYFKGSWARKFDRRLNRNLPFHINATTSVTVPMMYDDSTYRYGVSDKLQARLLELPYEGEEASMVIVLPNKFEGLNDVLSTLAEGHDLMTEIEENMSEEQVQISIPKFKTETKIDLTILLPKLGIKSIFSKERSGLDKLLANSEPLYVSEAVQKAFIEVNEEGAEAAAATAIMVAVATSVCYHNPIKRFVADRPFLVVIVFKGAPIFLATHRGNNQDE